MYVGGIVVNVSSCLPSPTTHLLTCYCCVFPPPLLLLSRNSQPINMLLYYSPPPALLFPLVSQPFYSHVLSQQYATQPMLLSCLFSHPVVSASQYSHSSRLPNPPCYLLAFVHPPSSSSSSSVSQAIPIILFTAYIYHCLDDWIYIFC